jgi:N-acetylmuramoyl-L-alanine amidase
MKIIVLTIALLTPLSLLHSNPAIVGKIKPSEIECLAKNVYHEARGESLKGQIAVAAVTKNRWEASGFPNSICKVVYQPYQFSWVKQLKSHLPKNKEAYEQAKWIAFNTLAGTFKDPTQGAMYYHANQVKPYWIKKVKLTTKIGNHSFYKHSQ